MNNKILNLLGVVGVTVGMTTVTTAAQASQLGPGRTDLRANTGIFFTNNIVDFLEAPVPVPKELFGEPGDGVTTTLPSTTPLSASGIFGIDPAVNPGATPEPQQELLDKLDGRTFLNAEVQFNDLGVDPNGVLGDAGLILSTVTQPSAGITEVVFIDPDEFVFLDFDTDGDGSFGEEDDFEYVATGFTRTVTSGAQGFNVSFDITGFFRDNEGAFKDTPSIISLFNGVSDVDPNSLPIFNIAQYDAFPGETAGSVGFLAGADGVITTEGGRDIPEPGTILGLTALAGLGLGTRLKRNSEVVQLIHER